MEHRQASLTGSRPQAHAAERQRAYDKLVGRLFDRGAAQAPARYRMERVIGVGGFGVVFEATDTLLHRSVAVKTLERVRGGAEDLLPTLRHEARLLAAVDHPNVLRVFDVGEARIVMEFVRGTTLRQWARRRPPWRTAIEHILAAGRGLQAAHEAGVTHRDVKPDNVMIGEDDRVVMLDFGLARLALAPDALGHRGRPDFILGTPGFMAPEHHSGQFGGVRSDIFSFCATAYWVLYGEPPFGARRGQVLAAKLAGPPSPTRLRGPKSVLAVLQRGLQPKLRDRWGSVEALLAALECAPRRNRRLGVALGFGALALASFAFATVANTDDRCAVAHRLDAQADSLATAFAGVGPAGEETWSRIEPKLRQHASEWSTARAEVCAHGPGRGADVLGHCLDVQALEYEHLLARLAQPDDALLDRAVSAVEALPRPVDCDPGQSLAAPPVGDRQRVEAARAKLAAARAAHRTGQYALAARLSDGVVLDVEPLGYGPVLAEALLQTTRAHRALEDGEQAAKRAARAADVAASTGYDRVEAEASIEAVVCYGALLRDAHAAAMWNRRAEAAIARGDLGPPLEAARLRALAAIANLEGRSGDARALLHRAALLWQAAGDEHQPAVLATRAELALAIRGVGELEEARARFEAVLTDMERVLGPMHANTIQTRRFLGETMSYAGEYPAARRELERVRDITAERYGEGPELARAEKSLGNVLAASGHAGEALDALRRSVAALEVARADGHTELEGARLNLVNALTQAGELTSAHALVLTTIESVRAADAESSLLAYAVDMRAGVALGLGEFEEATEAADEAVALYRTLGMIDHVLGIHAMANLSQAHLGSGDAAAALEAALHAQAALERVTDVPPEQASNVWRTLGEAQVATGRARPGIATLGRAVEEAERASDSAVAGLALFALARAAMEAGNKERAKVAGARAEAALANASNGYAPRRKEVTRWRRRNFGAG